MQEKCFAVIGEDGRQQAAAEYLRRSGCRVVGAEQIQAAQFILLPMPLSAERAQLAGLLRAAGPGAKAYAGRVSEEAALVARRAGVPLYDYLQREELAVCNAIPTCEGAIGILLRERSETLWGSRVLITGYGRIAGLLAERLAGFGAQVTIAARSPGARAMAAARGFAVQPIGALAETALQFQIIINTVPAPLIGQAMIGRLLPDVFLLDLASAPGGIDLAAAGAAGIKAVWALSLPARCAPVTAGRFVAQTVLQMIEERDQDGE